MAVCTRRPKFYFQIAAATLSNQPRAATFEIARRKLYNPSTMPVPGSIVFILCRTQFASNLGSAARVMKNMGLGRLLLVAPQCEVGMEARTRAMKGAEILDGAQLFPSLEAASREVALLVGTSGHFEPENPRWTENRVFCEQILPRYLPGPVGIAFGSEDSGLNSQEASLCQWLIEVPSGSEYGVLNLAQAVAIVAYEVHLATRQPPPQQSPLHRADATHVEGLLHDARRTLTAIGYSNRAPLERVMKRLQKLAGRAQLEVEDVNLLRGILRHLRETD